jgi:hypothetical protein
MSGITDACKTTIRQAASDAVIRTFAQARVKAALDAGKPVTVADWDQACQGDPLEDRLLAKNRLIMRGLLIR